MMGERKMQKLEWMPTEQQRKQLETMLNPDNWGKSKSELIKLSGISRPGYYKNLENPDFRRYFNLCLTEQLTYWKPEVIKKVIDKADSSFNHLKLACEVTGLLLPEGTANNIQVNVNNQIPDLKMLSDKELEKLAKQYQIEEEDTIEVDEWNELEDEQGA